MNTEWQTFLEQQSARIEDGIVRTFADQKQFSELASIENTIADLSGLDVVEIAGTDAENFLHGQLSSDVSALADEESQLSSWCNVKGRVLASFLLYRNKGFFYMLLQRNLTEKVIKRLQMFVLRSDVMITRRSDDLVRIGIKGESLHTQFHSHPGKANAELVAIRVPDTALRSILLCPVTSAPSLWQALSETAVQIGNQAWINYDIQAGIAWIDESNSEEFLPQSLNLDVLGGLSFDKGCYPGQEIVARMHFRGKLKQRMYLAQVKTSETPISGTRLYSDDVGKHIGQVVNTGLADNDHYTMLVALELDFAENKVIHFGSMDGPRVSIEMPPYNIK